MGYSRIILKSDQEPAMVSLTEAVKQEKVCDVLPNESPVGESQSNGAVENSIK